MSIASDRDEGLTLAEQGILLTKIGTAWVRDSFMTDAEREAHWASLQGCWDKEYLESIDKPLFPKEEK